MVDYQAKHLLPKGENYASTILQLDVKLKKTEDAPIEELNLVAKMMQATNFHDKYFNSTLSVIKEIFVYEELIPRYRKLEKEVLEKSLTPDFCSVLPKFYGGRLSLNSESKVADLDSVILMENLRVQGYEVMDRKQGISVKQFKNNQITFLFHLNVDHEDSYQLVHCVKSLTIYNLIMLDLLSLNQSKNCNRK